MVLRDKDWTPQNLRQPDKQAASLRTLMNGRLKHTRRWPKIFIQLSLQKYVLVEKKLATSCFQKACFNVWAFPVIGLLHVRVRAWLLTT